MKSYLDLSGCEEKVKEFHKEKLQLPVTLGKHRKDIDIVMDELTRKEADKLERRTINYDSETVNRDWPVGFDLKKLPKGAVLHLVIE